MNEDSFTCFEIGKQFPGPVPQQEGIQFELWEDQPAFFMQFPGLNKKEKKIFNRGFRRYYYLGLHVSVPVALWIFDFPKPFGAIEGNFNARLVEREWIDRYMAPAEGGGVKNAFLFFLLDGDILKGIKYSGLEPGAIKLFHDTIKKQLDTEYSRDAYEKYLLGLFEYDTYDLMKMAVEFRHSGRKV